SSPLGLLSTFMGLSLGYNLFIGALEVTGAVLLFFRRTTTLGALILTGCLAQAVVLDFGYDVPLKLFSIHLLVMTLLILAPDVPRLFRMLVLNQGTEPAQLPLLFSRWRLNHAAWVFKIAIAAWAVGWVTAMAYADSKQRGDFAPRHALYGTYQVDQMWMD